MDKNLVHSCYVRSSFSKGCRAQQNIWISIKEGILKGEIEPKNNDDKYAITAMRGAHT